MGKRIFYSSEIVDIIGPQCEMLGPVENGGIIMAKTEPACYGPMITPELRSGHTVTKPVAVEGAEIGDGIAMKIRKIQVLSRASASGTETPIEGRYVGIASIGKKCPRCGILNPETYLEGVGQEAVRCKSCGSEVNPFEVTCGYTLLLDDEGGVGVTVPKEVAEIIAEQAYDFGAIPPKGLTHPALIMALADMPPGIITRVRPMVGNIGTSPAVDLPSSFNAGDLVGRLVKAPLDLAIEEEDITKRTDSHMDIDEVREGSILIAPVKIDGGGVVVGDAHAMQGDGEIAGHTTDVSAEVTLEVEVIKNLGIDGPILLPRREDLPHLARSLTEMELAGARRMAKKFGFELQEAIAPVQVVGSGVDLNAATANGLERMAELTGMNINEVRNRVTLTGGVEIGRLPGVVHITMLAPVTRMEELGIAHLVRQQYIE
ncbi:MAG: acetamidase [Nitrososphaeria archaeon]|nr:acetamidase [Nitrososphaeria archaeon]NIN53485.1 acetamidase [Nitrososphaeria archaeon]NIQ34002.1 acetamidase [Nitrososphaeria archaeon]